jgi:hypothetical protein
VGTFYPPPFHTPCLARARTKLGDAAGLTQFGVNLLRLPPGAWSSQRHWQTLSDEFVFVLAGEVTLVTDAGEEVLKAGEAAGFNRLRKDGRLRMGERIFVQERMTRRHDVVASWQAPKGVGPNPARKGAGQPTRPVFPQPVNTTVS